MNISVFMGHGAKPCKGLIFFFFFRLKENIRWSIENLAYITNKYTFSENRIGTGIKTEKSDR